MIGMANENGRAILLALLREHAASVGETDAIVEARAILASPDAATVRAECAIVTNRLIRKVEAALGDNDPRRFVMTAENTIELLSDLHRQIREDK